MFIIVLKCKNDCGFGPCLVEDLLFELHSRTNMGYAVLFSKGRIDPMGLSVIQRKFKAVSQIAS